MIALRGDYCNLYERVCRRLAPARRLYIDTAEKRLGLPRRREVEAAELAARYAAPSSTCSFLRWAVSNIPDRRVCVLGPLFEGDGLGDCDVIVGVEQVTALPYEVDVLTGDLDSLNGAGIHPKYASLYWLVHVHGDNTMLLPNNGVLDRVQRDEGIVFTSQAICLWPVLGIGGFTDGDRLAVFSMYMGASAIALLGFDFDRAGCVGKAFCNARAKEEKLRVAREIIWRASMLLGYRILQASGGVPGVLLVQ
ncbi:MAG: hypothetical protein GSR73_04320 [Desulfurococcales archaeon]|nr:hypothetical protein [Desulfurococcales archaeon]